MEVVFEHFAQSLLIVIIGFHTLWDCLLQCSFPLGMAIDECGSHDYKQAIPRVLSVSILFIGTHDDQYELFLSQTSKLQSKSSRTNRTTSRTLQRHSTALTGTEQSQKAENSKLARKQPTFMSSTPSSLYIQHSIIIPFILAWITYNLLECFFA